MKTITLPGISTPISTVVQGAMGLLNLDDAGAFACLDAALNAGINAFDAGHVYAYGDRTVDGLLGAWIRDRDVRDQVVIMSKGCHPEPPDWEMPRVSADAVNADVVDSLHRMELDYLDLWSFHRDDSSVDMPSLVDAVNAEVAAGRVQAWGVSNWSATRIQEAIDYAASAGLTGPVAHSAHYSLADQVDPPWDDVVTLTGEVGGDDRQWHTDHGFPVIAWSALASGLLSSNLSRDDLAAATEGHLADVYRSYHSEENWARRDRAAEVAGRLGVSLSDVAIAWLLHSTVAPMAIVGGATPAEIQQNAAAAAIELTPADCDYLFTGQGSR